jgi:uncharacterized oligopeptide transporter (OPT) family protein
MDFKPFIAASKKIPELTLGPVLIPRRYPGNRFRRFLFLYLALKVGMTVSASIPVAVLSITVFRALSKVFRTRPATILENNMTQTTGSAGESIAFGIAVTMPALLILGHEMELTRVMVVAVLGALLGAPPMIPFAQSPGRSRSRQIAVSGRYRLRQGARSPVKRVASNMYAAKTISRN